jgi:hypothetical protein
MARALLILYVSRDKRYNIPAVGGELLPPGSLSTAVDVVLSVLGNRY